MPLIRAAFHEGRLSFDKVRVVTRVASAEEDEMWLSLALDASGTQLSRICRAVGQAIKVDSPDRAKEQHARRSLQTRWLPNGMLNIVAQLPPEDGKLFLEAVEAAMTSPEDPKVESHDNALDRWAARRADGMTLVANLGLGALQGKSEAIAAKHQVVVHVDFDLLTGLTNQGRCHLEDGPALALQTAKMLGYNASVVAMVEKNGQVLDVRPAVRFPTARQRRVIAHRDRTCLFPGCGVPAKYCEPHHVKEWALWHETKVDDLGSLCLRDHQRQQRGEFRMIQVGPGRFRFETPSGEQIPPVPVAVNPMTGGPAYLEQRSEERGVGIDWDTPFALGGGASYDLGLTVEIAIENPRIRAQQRQHSSELPAP